MYKKIEADKLIKQYEAEFKKITGREVQIRYKLKPATKRASLEAYALRVARAYSIKVVDLRNTKRKMEVVIPRWVFVYICKIHRYKPHEIANFLGNDRTTVYNAIEGLKKEMAQDIELEEKVNSLIKGRKCI